MIHLILLATAVVGPFGVDVPALEAADRVIVGSMLPTDEARALIGRNVYASMRYLRWGVHQPDPQLPLPLRHETRLLNALNELVLLARPQRRNLSAARLATLWESYGTAAEDALAVAGHLRPPKALADLFTQNKLRSGTSKIARYLREYESIPNEQLIDKACSLPYTDQLGILISSRRDFAFDALVKAIPVMEKKFAGQKYWDGCYKAAIRSMMVTQDPRLRHFNIEKLDPQQFTQSESLPIPPEFPWVEWAFIQWEMHPIKPYRKFSSRPRR
ncbi:MAG: hypothetical protein ACI9U2_002353 [Bradymonadia bacterium]|jgi:hypothetical protein